MGNKDIGGKKKEVPKKSKTEEKAAQPQPKETSKEKPQPVATTTSKDSHASKIIKCDCKHAYQDKLYGAGMRVHTPKKSGGWRCTVCSKDH